LRQGQFEVSQRTLIIISNGRLA